MKAFKDKAASQQLAAKLEREAELARAGVVDRYKEHRKRPLVEHLADFEQSLLAKGATVRHAEQTTSRVRRLMNACGFKTWTDISASKLQTVLAEWRHGDKNLSAQTFNFYLKHAKQFCRWMVQDRRASESPLQHLQGLNVRTDRRHDRRALEPDEVRRLLEATRAAGERFGMSGYERAVLYRLAVETGLRRNELRSLTVASFDLDKCTVTVEAAYSKHRRQDMLPLRPDTAAELKGFLAGKLPNVRVFSVGDKTCKMIKADLEAAGIPYVDESGRYADFHSLRHTTGSWLAANGVHPSVAQAIMRHSDINLTMSRYTHLFRGQESEAVAKLPDLSLPSSQHQENVATGTDNMSVEVAQSGSEKLTPKLTPELTPTAYFDSNHSAANVTSPLIRAERIENHKPLKAGRLDNKSEVLSPSVTDKKLSRLAGLEPATFGSVDRRSVQLSYRRNPYSPQTNYRPQKKSVLLYSRAG